MKILREIILIGMFAGAAVFSGCNSEKHSPGDGVSEPGQLIKPQQHSGTLPVKILPVLPTSSDNLQAIFSDGSTLGLRWEKNGQVLENEKTPRLGMRQFARGDTISLTVTSGGKTGKAIVQIANSLPEIRSARFTPECICRGENVTVVADGFDADGDGVKFSYNWIINGDSIPQDSDVLQGDKFKKGDKVSVIIVPQDNYGAGKPFKSQLISIPNASPWFVSIPPTDFKGNMYSYAAEARDPDGDAITYSLVTFPEGMKINSKNGMVTWPISTTSAGNHVIEVAAQDSEGAKASQKYSLKVLLPPKEVN
jgi:hypothetical protein